MALQNASGGNAPVCHLPSGIENSLLLCLAVAVSAVCGFIFTHRKRGELEGTTAISSYLIGARRETYKASINQSTRNARKLAICGVISQENKVRTM